MNNSIKTVRMIPWLFVALYVVISIIGVLNIGDKIPITYTLSGPNWEGSKYFLFVYPLISLVLGVTLSKEGEKDQAKGKKNFIYLLIGNLVVGGFMVYTVITNWVG